MPHFNCTAALNNPFELPFFHFPISVEACAAPTEATYLATILYPLALVTRYIFSEQMGAFFVLMQVLAVALGQAVYLWNAATGSIEHLLTLPDQNDFVTRYGR